MANGNDERFNPNRRPQRPMTDDEAIEALKKAFPGSKMLGEDEEEENYDTLEDELEYLNRTGIDPMTGERWDDGI